MRNKILPVLTIFLGAALLFGVQPLVGRTLLPFFGGTSSVWIVCLCSFQVLLLAGYFYADIVSHAKGRRIVWLHVAVLIIAALWAIGVGSHRDVLKTIATGFPPVFGVVISLVLVIGLPYVALSANSSLVQALSSRSGGNVYRLYAVSNAGSLFGLLAYPFLLEPFLAVGSQWTLLGVGLLLYAVLLGSFVGQGQFGLPQSRHEETPSGQSRPKASAVFVWIVLPAVSCAVLNAVTAYLTLNVIAMPLLWCLLLALFLISYVIGFSGMMARFARTFDILTLVSAASLVYARCLEGSDGFLFQLVGGCGLVLFGCSAVHIRLYALRPEERFLTRYYLWGTVGGAIGGVLSGLVAPLSFTDVYEFPCALGTLLLALGLFQKWKRRLWLIPTCVVCLAIPVAFVWCMKSDEDKIGKVVYRDRGFFGTVRVTSMTARYGNFIGKLNQYFHGTTLHCAQFVAPEYGIRPALYYTPLGGGLAITQHPKYKSGAAMRVGIVGMGMGVSCAYGRSNDVYRCWEISPEALALATDSNYFTYASGSAARVETVLGDARLALEKERAEGAPKYDILQIDAFSGDSIPYHLSTREAFQLYFDRLAPGGYLSVHISSWQMDLYPLIKAVAMEFGCHAMVYVPYTQNQEGGDWALMSMGQPKGLVFPRENASVDLRGVRDWALPTDEKGSLIGLLFRRAR